MRRAFARAALLSAFLVSASVARGQTTEPVHKTETSGLALTVGIGNQYPIFGAQVAYYVQIPHSLFRVVPYVGGGFGVCVGRDDDSSCTTGGVGGVMGSWGHKHRVVLNAAYGTVGAFAIRLHGQSLPATSFEGIGLGVGYEYMAFNGFVFRSDIGLAYAFLPPLLQSSPVAVTLTLIGVGYKLW